MFFVKNCGANAARSPSKPFLFCRWYVVSIQYRSRRSGSPSTPQFLYWWLQMSSASETSWCANWQVHVVFKGSTFGVSLNCCGLIIGIAGLLPFQVPSPNRKNSQDKIWNWNQRQFTLINELLLVPHSNVALSSTSSKLETSAAWGILVMKVRLWNVL